SLHDALPISPESVALAPERDVAASSALISGRPIRNDGASSTVCPPCASCWQSGRLAKVSENCQFCGGRSRVSANTGLPPSSSVAVRATPTSTTWLPAASAPGNPYWAVPRRSAERRVGQDSGSLVASATEEA